MKNKKYIYIILLIVIITTGIVFLLNKTNNKNQNITRKEELVLEGFINDYFYRRGIKDNFIFSKFDAYGSVLFESINIYVYPKNNLSNSEKLEIENMLSQGIQSSILDFPDFKWAESYSFNIIIK